MKKEKYKEKKIVILMPHAVEFRLINQIFKIIQNKKENGQNIHFYF